MNNKNQEIKTLNQHSALTTHNLKQGEYYKLHVEKIIFILLLKSQELLKESFRKIYLSETSTIFKNNQSQKILKNFFYKEKFEIEEYNKIELIKKINLINKEKKSFLNKHLDEKEIKKILKTLDIKSPMSEDSKISPKEFQSLLKDIQEHCKKLTIQEHLDSQIINFTSLSNSIGAHSTTVKKELEKTINTILEFNYIDKKNINISITTNLISSVKFIQDKGVTWLEYQIPKEILNLLIIPEFYVPLENIIIENLKGIYTIRMYSLLKDHIKRGEVELTKEELFNFFRLPKSYQNKTNLVKKFLEPTLEEIKNISGIETKYEFIPNHKYEKIKFLHTKKKTKKENNDFEYSEQILKYIEKSKKNIFVHKVWNKRIDNKLKKIYKDNGEETLIYILQALYTGVKKEIKTSLIKYIDGILKIYFKEKKRKKEDKIKTLITLKNEEVKKIITKKEAIPSEIYEQKLKECIKSGISYDLAIKFLNIRFIKKSN